MRYKKVARLIKLNNYMQEMVSAHTFLKKPNSGFFACAKNKDLNQGLDLTPGVYTEPFNVI